jgi:hypothetical protein
MLAPIMANPGRWSCVAWGMLIFYFVPDFGLCSRFSGCGAMIFASLADLFFSFP